MAKLQSDPEWVRRNAEREAMQKARIEAQLKAIDPEHAPLLAELNAAGVKVRMTPRIQLTLEPEARPGKTPLSIQSIDDLINTRDPYPEAIPILIKHLRTVQHPVMIDCIARALTVKEARGTEAARLILDRLKQTQPILPPVGDESEARWALANALTVIADTSMLNELQSLIADVNYEDVKERLSTAVKRLERKQK